MVTIAVIVSYKSSDHWAPLKHKSPTLCPVPEHLPAATGCSLYAIARTTEVPSIYEIPRTSSRGLMSVIAGGRKCFSFMVVVFYCCHC